MLFIRQCRHDIFHIIHCISCSRCGMLHIGETGRCLRTRFGEHRRAVTSNDASQPFARHFNRGSHCVSEMKIRALCPISGSNDSRKRHEMRLISKLRGSCPISRPVSDLKHKSNSMWDKFILIVEISMELHFCYH